MLREDIALEELNDRLNVSQAILTKRIGSRAVNQLILTFRIAAEGNQKLWNQLHAEPDPYAWLARRFPHKRLQMPSKSKAQAKLMQAAAHTPGGFGDVPQKVGKEFVAADKKQDLRKLPARKTGAKG